MSDNFEPSLGPVKSTIKPEPKPHVREGGQKGFYQPGSIAKEIGTGEHAKDSFIWMTLKYCFYLGAVFSICLMLVFFHFSFDRNEPEKFDVISALKDVWSIFTPILTLALGYAFGKREA
ncbi:MAG: hypothetical protein E6314_00060 [Enterobacter sp.]|mgnify:CR=1 FL=1|uniref:hypothetical protein n=1 Tax=Enterobacteriaceae TaxID=543 RepID=UPI000CDCB0EF|nr:MULTISPECIES: hypothetical protein [Citrobacter freundii complex]MDU7096858.1 hypothetical protein [Enterobacter sp.]MDU7181413.1 hypothetical protein [Enterobacter roggenkampii]HCP5153102.1 hypothetical protein [Escherichia coli]AUZ69841.1 hypothetical protein C2U41_11045 [Citrobacter freundii complex sp. CFNIH4]EIP1107933.1 hypothetical protein [Citrobacter freundii]